MCNKRLLPVFVLAFVSSSWQASTPTTPYYTAGVVEFSSSSKLVGRLEDNLADYLKIITSDEAAETDIIVFPEATLNSALSLTSVPDPATNTAPCDQSEYASFLQKLSCQARASKKYIVINLTEMQKCTAASQAAIKDPRPCALYGYNTYNTNVVLDRNGTVVSRYRKYNLYYEPWNVTYTPEYGRFDTDFGVTFGHFICFDILFYTPTTELVKQGITDFIFSSMWFSELPFLTAAQAQQSWAYSYNVTLLASGASNPSSGSTGSGIYVGRDGPLVTVMNSVGKRQIYVAQVPKRGFAKQNDPPQLRQKRQKRTTTSYIKDILVKRDDGINNFTTEPVKLIEGSLRTNVCTGDFCCSFQYSVSNNTPPAGSVSYQYRLGAFDGDRIYTGIDPLGWSVCTVMACVNETLDGCGVTFDKDSVVSPAFKFETFSIGAYFTKTENALVMPNSVDRDLLPLPVKDFDFSVTYEKDENKLLGMMDLKTPNEDLLNFGIYVSYFGDRSSAYTVIVSKFLVVILSCVLLL